MVFLYIIIALILLLVYMFKLNQDLLTNKDNILRSMAALDATIIKKNSALLDLVGYAQEVMTKEATLIKEIMSIRHEINSIKPKLANSEERYKKQSELEKKIVFLKNAFPRYPELNKNAAFQKSLSEFTKISEDFEEKVEYFNLCVDKLNWSINSFPSSILASMANTKPAPPKYEK